jgi:hypothetical protein
VGFKITTAIIMKNIILWCKTPCSPVEVYWRFGRTYPMYLQDRRQSQAATNKLKNAVFWVVAPVDLV